MPDPSTDASGADAGAVQRRHLLQSWGVQSGYDPIPVAHTEGCWIYTTDGRKIFDLRSAHECINLGFRHPKVLDAMRAQMEQVVYVTDDFATAPRRPGSPRSWPRWSPAARVKRCGSGRAGRRPWRQRSRGRACTSTGS